FALHEQVLGKRQPLSGSRLRPRTRPGRGGQQQSLQCDGMSHECSWDTGFMNAKHPAQIDEGVLCQEAETLRLRAHLLRGRTPQLSSRGGRRDEIPRKTVMPARSAAAFG